MHTNFLNENELANFFINGYIKINDFVPAPLLEKLKKFFDTEMNNDIDVPSKASLINNGKKFVTNLDHICNNKDLCCLELLGYPPILQIAQQICGDDFFMIQEFAVMKNLGDNLPVLWHLDMLHERKGKCFTMGIYLDDANEGDGALSIVPQSHTSNKTICELSKEPSIEVPMKAGGILIHDMMLAHSSAPLVKNNLRRVIYFEFLSAAHVKEESIYTDELVQRRTRLLFAATKHYKAMHPNSPQFELRRADIFEDKEKEVEDILLEVYAAQIGARPSTYCFE
jgi:ectoine hydroxylase-related dioxygenase (phytanoyl-CoA dioxygenase family)